MKVVEVLSEVLALDPSEVTLESDLRGDFNASSLDLVQLLWTLEDELNEEIPDDVIDSFHSANDIVEYIVTKQT